MAPRSPTRPGGVLAVDHGTKRTGFAFADALGITRTPLEAFHGAGDSVELLDHIAGLLRERDFATLVVGLPLHADGSEGSRCAEVRAFLARAGERFPEFALATVDEHGTSKAAEERLGEAGYSWREGKSLRDSWAALVILEDWLRAR